MLWNHEEVSDENHHESFWKKPYRFARLFQLIWTLLVNVLTIMMWSFIYLLIPIVPVPAVYLTSPTHHIHSYFLSWRDGTHIASNQVWTKCTAARIFITEISNKIEYARFSFFFSPSLTCAIFFALAFQWKWPSHVYLICVRVL